MADETKKDTTVENIVAQNLDERQVAINKILASKEFILIGKDGVALVENIPVADVLPLLAHTYSYKLPQIIEVMVVATLNNAAQQFGAENGIIASAPNATEGEGK